MKVKFNTKSGTPPKEGSLCLCMCPNWCELGYQVAVYSKGRFDYPEIPNEMFDANVIAWQYLEVDRFDN